MDLSIEGESRDSMKKMAVWLVVASLLMSVSASAALKSVEVQVVASSEYPGLQKETGTLSFPEGKHITFQGDSGKAFTIACSDISKTTFTTESKRLKRVAVPAIMAAYPTLGFSLFLLALHEHGYFLAVEYGNGQQAIFSLGKNIYTTDLNATSACTGKPTELVK
jgi:hypothetical protein